MTLGPKLAALVVSTLALFAQAAPSSPTTTPTTAPATQPVKVELKDAAALKAALNKDVIVEGTISTAEWSQSGRVMRINFIGNDKTSFLAVIFQTERDSFDKAYGGDVAKALVSKRVQVSGTLSLYRDLPEIIIKRTDQLKVLTETQH